MKRTRTAAALVFLGGLAMSGVAYAESHAMDHSDHVMHTAHGLPDSTQAFIAANNSMHMDMAIEFTGDADVDFIRGMIPHHQGAVAMAEIVLEHGDDPEVAALARAIIDAQREEIAWMEAWLAARGY